MKKFLFIILSLSFAGIIYSIESLHASEGTAALCQKRCRAFQGMARYNCISKCTRFSRRSGNNSSSSSKVKDNYRQCSKICSTFKGIKNVQCMRVCLDRIKIKDRKNPNNIQNYSEACQSRCRNMPAKYKYKCLQRCKKSEQSGGRGSGSIKVW